MNGAELDRLYGLQLNAEVLRVIVEDARVDDFTLVTRELEACLGEVARDEPWFSALAPVRKARWRVHAVPLPSNHEAMGLADLLAAAEPSARRLSSGGSDELRHWVARTVKALRGLATQPSETLPSAVKEMLADVGDPSATLLVNDVWSVSSVRDHFAYSEQPPTAVLTPTMLRTYPAHDSQFVIGATRNYPDWIFTSPRAGQLTVVLRASARDRVSVDPLVPGGGMRPVVIGGQRMKRPDIEVVSVDRPPVNWSALRPSEQSETEHLVSARTFLLARNRVVLLEDAISATVFTVTPEAGRGELIQRVPARTIDTGTCVLLRQRWGEDDAIVQFADQMLGDRRGAVRAQQRRWKEALRFAVKRDGYSGAKHKLAELGCDASSLHRWLGPDAIRTQTAADFHIICSYADIAEPEAQSIWDAMGEIRSAHVRAGHKLRELLEEQLEGADLSPLDVEGYLEVQLPDLHAGSLAVYRVEARDTETVLAHARQLRVALQAGRL